MPLFNHFLNSQKLIYYLWLSNLRGSLGLEIIWAVSESSKISSSTSESLKTSGLAFSNLGTSTTGVLIPSSKLAASFQRFLASLAVVCWTVKPLSCVKKPDFFFQKNPPNWSVEKKSYLKWNTLKPAISKLSYIIKVFFFKNVSLLSKLHTVRIRMLLSH